MFKFWKKKEEPNYQIIELEAENNRLKDRLIEELQGQIYELKNQLSLFNQSVLTGISDPYEKTTDPQVNIKIRPRLSTMTEVAKVLEGKSLARKSENAKL